MKKKLIIALIAYLTIGVVFALSEWLPDVREFTCESDGSTPFASYYISTQGLVTDTGTFIASFKNPDPERCVRRAFEQNSLMGFAFSTAAWPFVMGMEALMEYEGKKYEEETRGTTPFNVCGDMYADRVVVEGVDVAAALAGIGGGPEGLNLCDNIANLGNDYLPVIGVVVEEWLWDTEGQALPKREDGRTGVYRAVLYSKGDPRVAADPFNQSVFIYKLDFNTERVYMQDQHDGGFREIGVIE